MTHHTKKSWTYLFDAIVRGEKTHDLRQTKDNIKVGDTINLRRFDQATGDYTGEEQLVKITYITSRQTPCAFSSSTLDESVVILSIQKV